MVVVAQLVRASVCGTEGRGFEPHHPPKKSFLNIQEAFFISYLCIINMKKGITFLVLIMYLMAMLKAVTPFISYTLNKAYIIKEYCINKAKPELKCDGKCYLKKQIEKENASPISSLPIKDDLNISAHVKAIKNQVPILTYTYMAFYYNVEIYHSIILKKLSPPPKHLFLV